MPLHKKFGMICKYSPFDQFLQEICYHPRKIKKKKKICDTNTHCEFIIWKKRRHKVEEVFVVFIERNSLQGDLCKDRFDRRGKLALLVPVLRCDGVLKLLKGCFQCRME